MAARRILPQLVAKLAIGLGALFLVGVLLAAIPNHRAPTVEGVSLEPGREAKGTDHSSARGIKIDEAKSKQKDAVQDATHRQVTAPKAGDSTG